jgi:manganese/iron transport system ATP-binding protein
MIMGSRDRGQRGAPQGIMASDVTVTYRNGHTALRHASFEIPPGTITALVGVNGAGKSTLFKAIMGFVPVASGEIRVLGMSVAQALKQNLIAYVLRIPSKHDHALVDAALARVGMSDYRKRQIGELSGGQRKRVFLARALAQEGQVILLDEPFTGVDVTTEEQIIGLMRDLRAEGRVMLVSTHNLGSVPDFCDRTIFVKGTVIASGKTEDTFTEDNLKTAFGGALRHFVLSGTDLHDDEDGREVKVITDDERPFVIYGTPKPGAADARDPG